jgi:hypothetical protein
MKPIIRITLTFLAVVSSYYFIFWGLGSYIMALIPLNNELSLTLTDLLSALYAILIGYFVWKKSGVKSNSLTIYVLLGAFRVGAIGFILGFFGPMIFAPSVNQGPLLGLLYTGPLSFVLGLIIGFISWLIKRQSVLHRRKLSKIKKRK